MPLGKPKNSNAVAGEPAANRRQRRAIIREEGMKKVELESLHPSWQAKKKLNNIGLVPSTGKKIKFDE